MSSNLDSAAATTAHSCSSAEKPVGQKQRRQSHCSSECTLEQTLQDPECSMIPWSDQSISYRGCMLVQSLLPSSCTNLE